MVRRAVVLLLLSQPVAAQELYRWESKDGQVHYTDDRSTIPKGVKAVSTRGAELGVIETGPAPRPVAPPPAPPVPAPRQSGEWGISIELYPLVEQAEQLASSGRAARAFEQLAEATRLATKASDREAICVFYGRIALERVGSGALDEAERFIRRGKELEIEVAELHLASGELAYAQGDAQRAIQAWERGLRHSPGDRTLKKRLEEVRKRSSAFGAPGVSSSKWVTVTFDGAEDSELAAFVVKTIEDSRASVNALYGYTGAQRVEVILYPARTFESAGPVHPVWAGGLYDGKIHLATGGAAKLHGLLGQTLLHEYGHRVLARTIGTRLRLVSPSRDRKPRADPLKVVGWPAWLDEGMAQLAPAGGAGGSIPCTQGHIAPLRSLEPGFVLLTENVRASYLTAKHAVEWLIARHGSVSIPKLLKAMSEGASFEDAFRSATGTEYSSFVEVFDRQGH